MDNTEIFCRNVQRIMKEGKLTKREMCKIMKISRESLNLIMCGELPKRMSVQILFNLCNSFNKSPTWFLTEDDV